MTTAEAEAAALSFAVDFAPDLLHVHHGMLWDVAERLRDRVGCPAVKSVHVAHAAMNRLRGIEEETLSLRGQRRALARADAVVVPSRAAAEAIGAPRRVSVIGHGIDDTDIARDAAFRRRPFDRLRVLSVGRFADVKGTEDLFELMPLVLGRVSDVTFEIVGGIPDNRRGEARWRERWSRSAPPAVRRRTRFTGWLPSTEVALRYADASLLVVPSRFETFGLVALEGMLHGLPVVAADGGGLGELIEHGETGLLSPAGDVRALVENVVSLLTDPERASALGRSAAHAVREARLWRHVAPRIVRLYRELRETRPTPRVDPSGQLEV